MVFSINSNGGIFGDEHVTNIQVRIGATKTGMASLDTLRALAVGGVTPSYRPTNNMIELLRRDGFISMRLINVEWDNQVGLDDEGKLRVLWSKKLERELETCRKQGFRPHIIIGQIVPHGLEAGGEGNKRYGIRSWPLYREYIRLFLSHVNQEWGFHDVVWEVGNEMDNNKFNWVAPNMHGRLDPKGYAPYLELYRVIANEIANYRSQNDGINYLVGGPGFTQNSMNHKSGSDRNWIIRFAGDVAEMQIPCDFISMHFYGSAGTRKELVDRTGMINAVLHAKGETKPIWITEWGASAFFQKKNENFQAIAGAFSLDFIKTVADSGVDNALFIAVARHTDLDKSGPALLQRDGSRSHAYEALHRLLSLKGERIVCDTGSDIELGCIAARKDNQVQVIVWRIDWNTRRMGSKPWIPAPALGVRHVEVHVSHPSSRADAGTQASVVYGLPGSTDKRNSIGMALADETGYKTCLELDMGEYASLLFTENSAVTPANGCSH